MSGINFREDVQLQDWEAMLAELQGDKVEDLVTGLEADTWEEVKHLDYQQLPHFGNAYASVLLNRLEGELRSQVGGSYLRCEKMINATNTSFSVCGTYINNMADWKDLLIEETGLEDFEAMIDVLMTDYSPVGSKVLSELHTNGKDATIEQYVPKQKQQLKEMCIDADIEDLALVLQWALGAACLVKAVIDEHINDDLKHCNVLVEMYDTKVVLQVLENGIDVLPDYKELPSIINLTKVSNAS